MINTYKTKVNIDEMRKISLDILLDVTKFCDENNITYFLACGTLLGAVRHKGFIPWDDDVDIMMFREDFNKFFKTFNSEKYELLTPKAGRIPYGKVCDKNTIKFEKDLDYTINKPLGVDIDIFPLDGYQGNKDELKKDYKKECFLEMLLRLANQPLFLRKNPLKMFNRLISRIIGRKNIIKLIIKHQSKYSIENSDFVVRMKRSNNGFTGALEKGVYEKDYLEFEGHSFCVPKGYDKWLTSFFGNYMTLPPEEKRKIHISECYRRYE